MPKRIKLPKVGESFFAHCRRDGEGHCMAGSGTDSNPSEEGTYKAKRDPSYYGKAVGGVPQNAHEFIVDWQDSPTTVPTKDVIRELKKYAPSEAVVLYRGGAVGGKAPLKSWSYDESVGAGFAQEGEKVIKRKWYPDEILIDFTKLPQEYKEDMDANGMGTALSEVVVAYGDFLKQMKEIRK